MYADVHNKTELIKTLRRLKERGSVMAEPNQKKNMRYRKLGKTGVDISVLSFGAMRWLSEESCYEIMQRGMDLGMNYVDTSSGYVDGQSEIWTGKAVKNRRSDIYFSSKSNWAQAPSESKVRESIELSLKKTGLDYFDFYQLWGLGSMKVLNDALRKGGTFDGIQKAMNEGLIKYGLGFTFHGPPEVFKAAIDSGVFVSTTVSYNLMNRKQDELLDYAAERGVGVIIMNPLAGGVLAMAGGSSFDFLSGNGCGSWYGSLRFLFANSSISTCLLGLNDISQLEQNMKALDGIDKLDENYKKEMAEKMDAVEYVKGNFCTSCGYCKVCSNRFDPSFLMKTIRDYTIYGVREENFENWLRSRYLNVGDPEKEIQKCLECGLCEEKCPQHLKIVKEIQKVKLAFKR